MEQRRRSARLEQAAAAESESAAAAKTAQSAEVQTAEAPKPKRARVDGDGAAAQRGHTAHAKKRGRDSAETAVDDTDDAQPSKRRQNASASAAAVVADNANDDTTPPLPTKPVTVVQNGPALPRSSSVPVPAPERTGAALMWLLPDEIWVRIFQMGRCFLPLGRMQQVCRRFAGIAVTAAEVKGPPLSGRFDRCHHCLGRDPAEKLLARHYDHPPICLSCSTLPMYTFMCFSHIAAYFRITHADCTGPPLDYERPRFTRSNPHSRSYGRARMRMFLFSDGEAVVRRLHGDALANALSEYRELGLNPFVTVPDLAKAQAATWANVNRLYTAALAERAKRDEAAAAARRVVTAAAATVRRHRRAQLDRAVRACADPAATRAETTSLLGKAAVHQFVWSTDAAPGSTVATLQRLAAVRAVLTAASLPVVTDVAIPPGSETLGPLGRELGTVDEAARAFAATGTYHGRPIDAAVLAAMADAFVRRRVRASALWREMIGAEFPRTNGGVYVSTGAAFTCAIAYIRLGEISSDGLAAAPTARWDALVAALNDLKVAQDNAVAIAQQRPAAVRSVAGTYGVVDVAREQALAEAVAADRPIRWVITGLHTSLTDPNTLDAATRAWLRGCLQRATTAAPTDGADAMAAPAAVPMTRGELHHFLVEFGRRSDRTPTRLSDIPMAVRPFLKPGWPTDVSSALFPSRPYM